LGCEGRIEEAQGVLKLSDQLKEERIALQEVIFASSRRKFNCFKFLTQFRKLLSRFCQIWASSGVLL